MGSKGIESGGEIAFPRSVKSNSLQSKQPELVKPASFSVWMRTIFP